MAVPPPEPRPTPRAVPWRAVGIAAALILLAAAAVWLSRASLVSEEEVRATILTTIQSEAPERFLVTGTLTSSLSTSSARRWRVAILNVETGRATVRVQVPGRMSYGFSLDDLDPDDIRFLPEGIVEIAMPELSVFSVEPILEEVTVDSETSGFGRLSPELTARAVETTFRRVRPALREQAEAHLASADQPEVNTARAVAAMLSAPLEAAGVEGARFRFVLAGGDTLTLGDGGSVRALGPSEVP